MYILVFFQFEVCQCQIFTLQRYDKFLGCATGLLNIDGQKKETIVEDSLVFCIRQSIREPLPKPYQL